MVQIDREDGGLLPLLSRVLMQPRPGKVSEVLQTDRRLKLGKAALDESGPLGAMLGLELSVLLELFPEGLRCEQDLDGNDSSGADRQNV